jgi:tol-pal system protein YbgF
MAPSAPSQSRKITLEDLMRDLLDLQNTVKEMQRSADAKNVETKAALDQILARFSTIDSSVKTLSTSLAAIKTEDEKSAKELQQSRAAVIALKDSIDKLDLGQTLLDIRNGMSGLKTEFKNSQNTEAPLPTSRQAFDSAYGLFSQGFYDDAISELRDFLKAYPKDPRAAKAQLTIGTVYTNQRKFDLAILEYDRTIQTYPESDTKCTALYKKGQAFVELKQTAQAKEVFQSVEKDCPDLSSLATTALAELAKKPAAPARGGRGAQ